MKINKKLMQALVILVCLTIFSGCGPNEKGIKIGGNFELTGDVAQFGKKGENGAKLAIKEINLEGGVLGGKIEYISADNKSDAAESASVTEKLIAQDKVVGIVGPMTNLNTMAAISEVTDNKVVLVTPTGTESKITVNEDGKLNQWLFRACFVDSFQGEAAAHFALDNLKITRAALVIDQTGKYSGSLAKNFKSTFEAGGGRIVASEQYVSGEDTDFSLILARIKTKNPELVFMPGYYAEAGLIIKQARKAKMNIIFLGGDGWGTGPMMEIAGVDNLNNCYYIEHSSVEDPALSDFAVAYKKEYNQEADSFSVLGYDAAKLLIVAIEKAGSTEPEKVRQALEKMTNYQGISGVFTIDPITHNPQKSAVILQFRDGKKVFVTRVNPK